MRAPRPGEADRRIVLRFLDREEALDFASRDLACHRLAGVIGEVAGPLVGQLDGMVPEQRVRWIAATVRRLFAERPAAYVLHEPATEQLEKIEQFLAFIDSARFLPGGELEVSWEERGEYLMGRRRPDGRTLDVGRLLSLRLVELVRSTGCWGGRALRLVDSPWIPTFHNARRADLILREAMDADVLVVVTLPEPMELEGWVEEAFRARPELAGRTVIVYNQVDTVDPARLLGRGGFAESWSSNLERFVRRGLRPENVLCTCARLAFLQGRVAGGARACPGDAERADRLRAVLAGLARQLTGRPTDAFAACMNEACLSRDAGISSLRARLLEA